MLSGCCYKRCDGASMNNAPWITQIVVDIDAHSVVRLDGDSEEFKDSKVGNSGA